MKQKLITLVTFAFATFLSFAQITQGTVTYDMVMNSADEMMQQQLDMMGVSKLVLTFQEKNFKSEMTNMFMNQKTIYNENEDRALMLSEMMGAKNAINMTSKELEEKNKKESGDSDDTEVIILEEFKEIAGYKCQKIIAKSDKGDVVMFVTKEVAPKSKNNNFSSDKFDGFPLEIVSKTDQGGATMTITMTATAVKEAIKDKDPFTLAVPKGYKEMTYGEFEAQMKKMRGGN